MSLDILRPGAVPAVPAVRTGQEPVLRCAFVNNMPDPAFAATERQFLGLLDAGARAALVEVRRYAFAALPRGPKVGAYQADEYFPIDELWDGEADIVIVTGSEPLADRLDAEPYWPETIRVLDWTAGRRTSVMLSCLAAHSALLAFDGIQRSLLPAKCAGLFAHEVDRSSPLTTGMALPVLVPHSRLNDVTTDAVAAAGYDVVASAPGVGWSAITARRAECDVLLLQGHPEYDATSLLREYRRDAGRYLRGERDVPPVLPPGCVGAEDAQAIDLFHERVRSGPHDPEVLSTFDFEATAARAPWPWRTTATVLYSNWIDGIAARKAGRAVSSAARETR